MSSGASRRRYRAIAAFLAVAAAACLAVLFLDPDERMFAWPILSIGLTATLYMLTLWARDGAPPVFEPGTLCMLAITVYGAMPMAGFLLMHGRWDPFCDGRLHAYPFIGSELATFGWRYAAYAAAFAITYLLVRGRAAVKSAAFTMPQPNMRAAMIFLFIVLYSTKLALKFVYDYDPDDFNYADLAGSLARQALKVVPPYIVLQIAHNALGALFVVELGLMILLIAQWRRLWCRAVLAGWLLYEIFFTVVTLGSRGRMVLLLLAAGVLYHRLVKAIRFRTLVIAGGLLLLGFLILGAIRVVGSKEDMRERVAHVLTAGNEFQGLFTTAFDIHKKKEDGLIRDVPWQVYVADFYFPIPSQLLPFEKVDPSSWYIDLIGQTGRGIGYMFGVMSQAALGYDWIELVLRGAVLAICLALLQRWYVRRSHQFWPTLLSLFVSLWAYYTMRASSFYFVYFVLYHFVPVLVAAKVLERLLSRVRRRSGGMGRQALVRA